MHSPGRAGLSVRGRRGGSLPPHEATTAQLGAAYPFTASPPLPVRHVLIGRDAGGAPFAHDPFDLYASGALTNPNITVLGQIGRGKSALVKSYLLRQAAFGRRIAVLDPKGEYGRLARALGTEPVVLSPRGGTRINPLEAPVALTGGEELRRERLALVSALSEATMGRRLAPPERLALELALDSDADHPSLGRLVCALLSPSAETARRAGVSPEALVSDGRLVALELRRLVAGDLAGMFDADSTPASLRRPACLVVDLSDVYHSDALPALMVCAAAWLSSITASASSRTVFVVDEAWALVAEAAVRRYLRASWKLARARGLANVAVCHRASDLTVATGDAGEAHLAEGLLADSETVVCYAQPASELGSLAALLGCSPREIAYLPRLGRGVALWRVGGRRYLVEHFLSSRERAIVDTDERLVPARS